MRKQFTVVIPTIGRDTLSKTLQSIPGGFAETIVIADTFELPRYKRDEIRAIAEMGGARFLELDAGKHDVGSSQIEYGMLQAQTSYILNCGDDDIYERYGFQTLEDTIDGMIPHMYRVVLHPTPGEQRRGNQHIAVLWQYPRVLNKNVTGQCFIVPNLPEKMGSWHLDVDFGFIQSTIVAYDNKVNWREDIIMQCY